MLELVAGSIPDEFELPQPISVYSKRVRFRYVGPGKPIPLDEDIDEL